MMIKIKAEDILNTKEIREELEDLYDSVQTRMEFCDGEPEVIQAYKNCLHDITLVTKRIVKLLDD